VIFIDTGAFLARHLARDQFHERAVEGWTQLSGHRCVTTSHVIDETLTLLARRAGHAFAGERARAILTSRVLQIERPDLDDELAALEQFERFGDQAISFTDALSFAVMRRLRIERAFCFDRHFALAGFELWPE
jgi:predicted nucleic acid-binding protein